MLRGVRERAATLTPTELEVGFFSSYLLIPTQLDFDYGALELISPTLSYMGRRGVEDFVAGRQLLARETGAWRRGAWKA